MCCPCCEFYALCPSVLFSCLVLIFITRLKLLLRVGIVDKVITCLEIFGVILALGISIDKSKKFIKNYFLCIYEHSVKAGF